MNKILKFILNFFLYWIALNLSIILLFTILMLIGVLIFWDVQPLIHWFNDIFSIKWILLKRIILIITGAIAFTKTIDEQNN